MHVLDSEVAAKKLNGVKERNITLLMDTSEWRGVRSRSQKLGFASLEDYMLNLMNADRTNQIIEDVIEKEKISYQTGDYSISRAADNTGLDIMFISSKMVEKK